MTRDPRLIAALVSGGFVGTVARALLADALPHVPGQWPWATLLVNLVGAFVLGVIATGLQLRPARSDYTRPLLATGFCGGLTTFSTLQLELVDMVQAGSGGLAVAYGTVSVVCGLLAVHAATLLVRARSSGELA